MGLSLSLPGLSHAYFQGTQEQGKFVKPGYLINIFDILFDLNLTEDQIKAFKELAVKTRISIIPLRKEIKELRFQIDENFLSENIATEEASNQIEKMVELRSKISTTYLNVKLEGVQLLTPEQRAMILDKKQALRDRFKNLINPLKSFLK